MHNPPDDWERGPLGKYIQAIDAGWSPECPEEQPDFGEWGVLKVNAVTSGKFNPRAAKRLPSHLRPVPNLEVHSGDVLIARANGVAELVGVTVEVRGAPPHLMLSDKTLRLTPHRCALDGSYLTFLLQSDAVRRQVMQIVSGSSGQKNISQNQIRKFSVAVPPIKEQRRIVEILDLADETISSTERLVKKLSEVRDGLARHFLSAWVDEAGQPGSVSNSRALELATVAEVAAPQPGSTVIGPFGSNLTAADYRTSGVPVVFVRDVRATGFEWISETWISPAKARDLAAHQVLPGDVLSTKMGLPPGVAAVYPQGMPMGVITADVIRIRPNPALVRSEWLSLVLNSDLVRRQVDAITGGVTRPKITLQDYRLVRVPRPCLKEQDSAIATIETHDRQANVLSQSLIKARQLRQGLAEDLLTGRVRVNVREGASA